VQRALRELQLLGLLSVHQRPGSTALYLATPAPQVGGGGGGRGGGPPPAPEPRTLPPQPPTRST
jgi:hypothetical protein